VGQFKRKVRKGVRWRYVGSYLGKFYSSRAIYLTKRECEQAERREIERLDEEARRGKKALPLIDLMTEKLDHIQLNQSRNNYNETKRYYQMLLDAVGHCDVTEVKKPQIVSLLDKFSAELKRKKKGNWNVNSMLRVLKALFYHAINVHDLDMKNPCAGIKFYPIDQDIKYIPTNAEIEAVMLECDEQQQLLVLTALETGARVNELLRLSPKDILGGELVLYTRKSKNSNLTSRKVPRPVCLPERFSGFHWKIYPRFLERKTKGKWGFHNLRHRFAAYQHSKGLPLYLLMERLGHSNLSTTQIYLRSLPSFCPEEKSSG
jgi:integrase